LLGYFFHRHYGDVEGRSQYEGNQEHCRVYKLSLAVHAVPNDRNICHLHLTIHQDMFDL